MPAVGQTAILSIIINAAKAIAGANNTSKSLKKLSGTSKQTARTFDHLGTAIKTLGSGLIIGQIGAYANAWTEAENRLRVYIESTQELKMVQNDLHAIAQRTFTEFDPLVGLFNKLLIAKESLGASTPDLLRFTETVSKAIALSGRSAQDIRGPLLQLGQALSTGRVYAEELNSIIEGIPAFARIVSKALFGVYDVGALKKAGRDVNNPLASTDLFGGGLAGSQEIDNQFKRVKVSLSKGFTVLQNALLRYIGEADQALGVTNFLGHAMIRLGNNLENVAQALLFVAVGVIAAKVIPIVTALGVAIKVGLIAPLVAFLALPLVAKIILIATAIAALTALFQDTVLTGEHGPATLGDKVSVAADLFVSAADIMIDKTAELYKSLTKDPKDVDKELNKGFSGGVGAFFKELGTSFIQGIGSVYDYILKGLISGSYLVTTFIKQDFKNTMLSAFWEAANESRIFLGNSFKDIAKSLKNFKGIDFEALFPDFYANINKPVPEAKNPFLEKSKAEIAAFQAEWESTIQIIAKTDMGFGKEWADTLIGNIKLVSDYISKEASKKYKEDNPLKPLSKYDNNGARINIPEDTSAIDNLEKQVKRQYELSELLGEDNELKKRNLQLDHKLQDIQSKRNEDAAKKNEASKRQLKLTEDIKKHEDATGKKISQDVEDRLRYWTNEAYYRERAHKIIKDTATAEAKVTSSIEEANLLRIQGKITQEQYNIHVKSLRKAITETIDDLKEENKYLKLKGSNLELIRRQEDAIKSLKSGGDEVVTKEDEKEAKRLASENYYLEKYHELTSSIEKGTAQVRNRARELLKLRQLGVIEEGKYAIAIKKIKEEYIEAVREEDKHFGDLLSAIETWGQKVEDVFVKLVQTGKLSFRDLADSIIADLIRIQIREGITRPLTNLASSFVSSFIGSPQPFTGSTSRITSDPTLFAPRARGGSVQNRGSYLVGERGPEAFVPNQDGRIVPTHQLASFSNSENSNTSSGVNVVINNYAKGAEVGVESRENPNGGVDLVVLIETVEKSLAGNIKRGRGLAPTLENTYALNPGNGNRR